MITGAYPPTGAADAVRQPSAWRDRGTLVAGAALIAVAAAAWAGVVGQAAGMASMGGMPDAAAMPSGMGDMADVGTTGTSSLAGALPFLASWGVMMAAMMLPSATPMILLYRTVSRSMSGAGQQVTPTALFAAVYLVAWVLVGIPVYAATVGVQLAAQSSATVSMLLPYAVAAVLLAAGAYQFTAIKRVCLRNCRSPLSFLMARWKRGYLGTLRVAVEHAAYCVGCCWGLMVVLVAAGAMGLPWVLLIAAAVFVEKLLPRGELTARAVGVALVALGVAVAFRPDLTMLLRGAAA